MKSFSSDQILFTFADMKRLALRHFQSIKKVTLIVSFVVFCFLILTPLKYRSQATFKQSAKQKDLSMNMKEMFHQFIDIPAESGAIAVMQSNTVIEGVVAKLGIQVECDMDGKVVKFFKRIWNNCRVELGGQLTSPHPFIFQDVSYLGSTPLVMYFSIDTQGLYQLYDQNKKWVAEASLGKEVAFAEGKLRLVKPPPKATTGKLYRFCVMPLEATIAAVRKRLKVFPHQLDKSILQLIFTTTDPLLGAPFLNTLMGSYQSFLKNENDEICKNQLEYLHQRQEELTGYYDRALSEHSAYLNENLSQHGFIGFAQEIETLSVPKNLYTSKLFDVDLELKRFYDSKATLNENPSSVQLAHLSENRVLEKEFSGLSLQTAQNLIVDYTRQRDTLQAQAKELIFLKEQLKKEDFEMSSLGGSIDDPVTRDIGNRASAIALQLKDENNRSQKEQERLVEALDVQKSFLAQYLLQAVDLKLLRVKLLRDKIHSLQKATLSLLQTEKNLLKSKLKDLNQKMGDLPEKWRRESLLTLKKELGALMLEGVSQLVETKSLGQHTFQISSRPLDQALLTSKPKPPRILLLVILSAFFAAVGYYFVLFAKALSKGLPASDTMLKMAGYPVSGKLSSCNKRSLSHLRDQDLQTLRHIAEFLIPPSKTALYITGKYPDYSLQIAELMGLRGLKVIVVQCHFNPIEYEIGLWQYLQGEVLEIPIRRQGSFDLLPPGNPPRHAPEFYCSSKFDAFLDQLKMSYDLIILCSDAEVGKIESLSLLKLTETVVVTHQLQSKEELEIYTTWAEKNERRRVTFVFAEEVF